MVFKESSKPYQHIEVITNTLYGLLLSKKIGKDKHTLA